ncbi:MAG: sigma-70 family RNA polymerase sigma factor [Verrucomicrobiales bacterium]|nr:sigma-70 family RNA polymerase sigma factor [Verrucomicrobiales bacterium]
MNVTDLLTEFREHRSEAAFAGIVRRHSALVFSVAWRRLSDAAWAEECTQEVFIRLVSAASTLKDEPALVAWLHATAHRVAIDRWRAETRRKAREEKAVELMSLDSEPRDARWKDLAPILDEALGRLDAEDRQAVLLRYFQSQSLHDVGLALGLSEDAAKMRLRRALARLQGILSRRGISCTAAALALLIEENAVDAGVPAGILQMDPATLLARAAARGSGAPGILSGVLLMKTKLAVILGALILGGWWWHRSPSELRTPTPPESTTTAGSVRRAAPARTAVGSRSHEEALADSLVQLEDILRSARRLRHYPPASLVEALRRCDATPTNAVALLRNSLASPDYETRHWAVEGLKVVLQLRSLKEGHEAARQALARVAVSREPDSTSALMSIFGLPQSMNTTTPSKEAVSPEVLRILSEGFRSTDPEILAHQLTVADFLNARLTASGQDVSEYQQLLKSLLASGDAHQRLAAAYALSEIPNDSKEPVLDILQAALADHSPGSQSINAAAALGRFGPDARESVPALEELLNSYPSNDPRRGIVKKSLHEIQSGETDVPGDPGSAGASPDGSKPPPAPGPGSIQQQFRRNLVEPLLAMLADPDHRRQFDEDAWFAEVTFPYEDAARDVLEESAASVTDPETAALLRRLKDRVTAKLPEEQDLPLDENLPPRGELLDRAWGVNELQAMNVPPETMARVRDLARKYGLRSGQADNGTPADLRNIATDLRQIDPRLYLAVRRSFLESYPWLDRVLP